jgi:arginyl-tRNA synthetase
MLRSMGVEQKVEYETPDPQIADMAFPCFPLAKQLRKAPKVIAEEVAAKIAPSPLLEKVWAENGYLNFKVNGDRLVRDTLGAIIDERTSYGSGEPKECRVLLEHTSVNPTGPIHVGRARNPLIGDTLARCLRKNGYPVTTEYLVNDVGKQVVLLTWGVEHVPPSEVKPASDRQKVDHQLVGYYQRANELMESDPAVEKQVGEMLRAFENGDPEVIGKVRATTERMLDGIKESLSRIGVELEQYTCESQFILNGEGAVVERLKLTPYAHQEEGAWYLDLSTFGIHGREQKFFFTRADGTTLYTTRDMAYHLDKFKRSDVMINVLGEDQKLGQAHLLAALKILCEEKAPECVYYSLCPTRGRMSHPQNVVVFSAFHR